MELQIRLQELKIKELELHMKYSLPNPLSSIVDDHHPNVLQNQSIKAIQDRSQVKFQENIDGNPQNITILQINFDEMFAELFDLKENGRIKQQLSTIKIKEYLDTKHVVYNKTDINNIYKKIDQQFKSTKSSIFRGLAPKVHIGFVLKNC